MQRTAALTKFVVLRSAPSTRNKKMNKKVSPFFVAEYNSWDKKCLLMKLGTFHIHTHFNISQ